MDKLYLGIEVRDFDLERIGFSLSVLDETKRRQTSEAYLRMTLSELNALLKALREAVEIIEVSPVESQTQIRLPPVAMLQTRVESAPSNAFSYKFRRQGDAAQRTRPR